MTRIPHTLALCLTLAMTGAAFADNDDDDEVSDVEAEGESRPLHNEIIDGLRAWQPDGITAAEVKNWKLRKADPSRWPDGRTNPIMTQENWTGGGGALTVYLWLRLEKNLEHEPAYALMKRIVALPPIKVADHPTVKAAMVPDVWSMVTVVDPYATGELGERPEVDEAPAAARVPRPAPTGRHAQEEPTPSDWSTDEEADDGGGDDD